MLSNNEKTANFKRWINIMSDIVKNIKNRTDNFSVYYDVSHIDWMSQFENEMLQNPRELASLKSYSYNFVKYENTLKINFFNIQYYESNYDIPVWKIANMFELHSACKFLLAAHYKKIMIIIDNRNSFFNENFDIHEMFLDILYSSGSEFELSQTKSTYCWKRLHYNNRIIIAELGIEYFNNAKEFNLLKCYAHKISKNIVSKNMTDEKIVREINKWFYENIKYENNGYYTAHSAVSALISGKGVCQAIAAMAVVILESCNIAVRYVKGESYNGESWEKHGWNIVKVNNQWLHVDFTFNLSGITDTGGNTYTLKNSALMSKDHKWNKTMYSSEKNDKVIKTKKQYEKSVFAFLAGSTQFLANGAVIEYESSGPPLIKTNNKLLFALLPFVELLGGYYEFYKKSNIVKIFYAGEEYDIEISRFVIYKKTLYIPAVYLSQYLDFFYKMSGDNIIITLK